MGIDALNRIWKWYNTAISSRYFFYKTISRCWGFWVRAVDADEPSDADAPAFGGLARIVAKMGRSEGRAIAA